MTVIIPLRPEPVKAEPEERLLNLITSTNLVALDKLLGLAQSKVNFCVAAQNSCRLRDKMMVALEEVKRVV